MSDRERYRYLLLTRKINVPGYMGSTRLNVAPGAFKDGGSFRDAVGDVWKVPGGYRVVVPNGAHKGEFELTDHQVDHAKLIVEHDAGNGVHPGRERHCTICNETQTQPAPQHQMEPDATPS